MATKMTATVATFGPIIILIGVVFGGVQVMDSRYVASEQFSDFSAEVYFSQYYETIDRIRAAKDNGENDYAKELEHRLERLKAKICKVEPSWERCPKKS